MRRIVLTAAGIVILLCSVADTAFAGLGDNYANGCGGFGSLGPVVGVGAACSGGGHFGDPGSSAEWDQHSGCPPW